MYTYNIPSKVDAVCMSYSDGSREIDVPATIAGDTIWVCRVSASISSCPCVYVCLCTHIRTFTSTYIHACACNKATIHYRVTDILPACSLKTCTTSP